MLAEIGDARSDPQWLYEPKMDGYRVIAYVEKGKVRFSPVAGSISRKRFRRSSPI